MNMQQRTFQSRVSKSKDEARRSELKIRLAIQTVNDDTGDVTFSESYTFTKPDEGRLFLMATAFGSSARPENAASEVDATLRAMLLDKEPNVPGEPEIKRPRSEYDMLRSRIDGPVDRRVEIEDLMEIIGVLTEEWAEGFPTQPSIDSPEGSSSISGRSTGRVHSQESTYSSSPSPEPSPPFMHG